MTEAQALRVMKKSPRRLYSRPIGDHPAWLRRDTQDGMIKREVVDDNEYRLPKAFDPGDVIIDVGAHVGCFAMACLVRGAGHVHCYEPDQENFRVLRRNLSRFGGRVSLYNAAVVGNGGGTEVTMVRFVAVYTAQQFVLPTGRDIPAAMKRPEGVMERVNVPAVDIGRVLESAAGRVRLLKLDCEGSEYPILASADLSGVDEIAGELHPNMAWPGIDCEDETVSRRLASQGFSVEVMPQKSINRWLFAKRRNVT